MATAGTKYFAAVATALLAAVVALSACTPTTHTLQASQMGKNLSDAVMEAQLQTSGPITHTPNGAGTTA